MRCMKGNGRRAKSLGLTESQTMVYAVLPQAVRNVPARAHEHRRGAAEGCGAPVGAGRARRVREAQIYTATDLQLFLAAGRGGLFLLATIPMARLADYVTRKDRERRLQRAG